MYIVFVCVVTVTSLFVSQHPRGVLSSLDSVETFDDLEDCSTTVLGVFDLFICPDPVCSVRTLAAL